ncbi:TerD family protein [Skermania piniformis]|uniref:Tellurium resistance protein n=1 Tax=Skermania pinensis TaxID=39122 RepID=A0ABX8S7A9_9ACTN|nr:Tellurium resistance [Skermania piniformis]QXQ12455.1 tellurium resistance protein [Skermania piniformis]
MAIDYNKKNPSGGSAAAPDAAAAAGPVSLSKERPAINLTKSGAVGGTMRVNLNWSQGAAQPAKKGFLSRLAGASGGIDLDLGCLWELTDGRKGIVQALGNSFGAYDQPPYIQLDQDDRTGAVTGGENMAINMDRVAEFRRILVFALIYEGARNWAAVDGVVRLFPQRGPQVEVRLDHPVDGAPICAIAMLENKGGDLTVQREVQYINGAQDVLDRTYGWGLQWKAGRK